MIVIPIAARQLRITRVPRQGARLVRAQNEIRSRVSDHD
jgi:hypothetical protein